ncbi:MAG: DUF3793 family protein [Spirochaetaceae bacterium]|nr:DUF3793 family protein [Spirochaetaceae bacterium]
MPAEIKRLIINHCGPVLMGYKPAAMFMLRSGGAHGALADLLPARLDLIVLRESEGGLLVLVFEKELLEKTLVEAASSNAHIRAALTGKGYPLDVSIFEFLKQLKKQFASEQFPHEVGLFLGYPVDDVLGFVKHKGQNYKFCGYWKVYGDVERAKARFRQYDECRECIKAAFQNAPSAAGPVHAGLLA